MTNNVVHLLSYICFSTYSTPSSRKKKNLNTKILFSKIQNNDYEILLTID